MDIHVHVKNYIYLVYVLNYINMFIVPQKYADYQLIYTVHKLE